MSLIQEIKTLQEISNDQTVTVVKTYFKSKDKVKQGDKVLDLQTSKAVFSYEAEVDGYIEYLCREGEEIAVGVTVTRIFDRLEDILLKDNTTVAPDIKNNDIAKVKFSQAALQLIEKEGLDKRIFSGKDFVTLEDVQVLTKKEGKKTNEKSSDDFTWQEISKSKKIEIASLSDVQSASLGCMVSIFVDTKHIINFARQQMEILKTSLLPFIIFETTRLLVKYPEFNAFYADGRVAFYRAINIGLAIDLDQGLKVVKLKDADSKSVKNIEQDILSAADKYLDNKLVLDDISGITFTITDLSAQGIAFFVPLINTRQSAILGISAIDEKLQRCVLTLTFDHRVTEGKKASEFLYELKERLESYKTSDGIEKETTEDQKVCSRCFMTLAEIDQCQGIGLFKVINSRGKEAYLCETCIAGW